MQILVNILEKVLTLVKEQTVALNGWIGSFVKQSLGSLRTSEEQWRLAVN